MSDPIKILHVLGRTRRGGAELRLLELARHVDRRRYRFHFCVLSGLPGALDDPLRATGSRLHLMRQAAVGFSRRFRTLLREHAFDVVEAHVLYYSGFILRMAAQCDTPIRVALLHSSHDGRPRANRPAGSRSP